MRIKRTFVWEDDRPDGNDELRSERIDPVVHHEGAMFTLRTWTIRYVPGQPRVTEAVYDEVE